MDVRFAQSASSCSLALQITLRAVQSACQREASRTDPRVIPHAIGAGMHLASTMSKTETHSTSTSPAMENTMSQEALEQALWKGLESDRTVMLGIADAEDAHMRPMTAQFETPGSDIWFFTSVDNHMIARLGGTSARGVLTYTAKDHDLFACIHGQLRIDTDRAVIDRLWNPFVAAWYEDGKDDPKLRLLRFEPEHAQVWENDSSFLAGIKLLLGVDPKRSYEDKVAHLDLR
jgi:general stress protein 26